MTIKPLNIVAAGLIAATMPLPAAAQDTQSTTTTEREDDGFNPGWLGLLGLAGLLGLKRRDNHVHTGTTGTTHNRV